MSHTPKIPGISNGVVTIETNVSTLQTDVSTLETDISTLESDISTLQTDISTLQGLSDIFNISTRDTEENIISTSPTNPEGECTIAYGTDTQDLYVWNGTVWYKFTDDQ